MLTIQQDWLWGVDFFDGTMLTEEAVVALRANKMEARKDNTAGEAFQYAIAMLYNSEGTRTIIFSNNTEFRRWLERTIGLTSGVQVRAMATLTSVYYRNVFTRFVATTYGRRHFEWTTAERIVNSKMPEVSSF